MNRIRPTFTNGGIADDSPNQSFCMAPFSHTYLSPQAERRLCCASREAPAFQRQYIDAPGDTANAFTPDSLEEHWNSPYMRDIRVKMLTGQNVEQCEICVNSVSNAGNTYRKWFTNVLFPNRIDEAFTATDDTGYTTMPVRSFDYRVSNLCNFKCRMCGEQLSSSWETEKRKHNQWTPENQPFMVAETRTQMSRFQQDVAIPEFLAAVERGEVEEIYWVGGEPLMFEVHWDVIKRMVENGSAKNCRLRYNTNLSRTTYRGMNLFDYLPEFKDYIICASIDGTGEIVEFIRTGIVWDQWLENFKLGLAMPRGPETMIIDLTITGPGLFSLTELFDLAVELNVRIETKIMFAFQPDIVFSPFALPRHILDRTIDGVLAHIGDRATPKQQTLVDTLVAMKSRPTFAEQFPDTHEYEFRQGRDYQRVLQDIRGGLSIEDIYAKHDMELFHWWTRP